MVQFVQHIKALKENLTVESVDLCDLSALVVPSEQYNLVGIHCLESQKLSERLQTVVAPVNKVSL